MQRDLFDIGGKPKDAPALITDTGAFGFWCRRASVLEMKRNYEDSRRGNLAILVEPEVLSGQIWEETVPGGFFFQGSGTDLTPLLPVLTRKVQTLTCFGVNRQQVAAQLVAAGVTGVDRIVEVGHALDFSLVWDGMDLIGQMSREIRV